MATAVSPRTVLKPAKATPAAPVTADSAPVRGRIDNQRTEDLGRFALVLMMPLVLGAMVLLIAFWGTPAVQ